MRRHNSAAVLSGGACLLALCCVALAVSAQDPPAHAQRAGRATHRAPSLHPHVSSQPLPNGRTYRLHTFRVSLAEVRLEVVDVRMSRALDDVLRTRGASLVINGGFFGMRGEPQGMVVSRGQLLSPVSARLGGGIVTTKEGVAHLHATETPPALADADFAMQCRPRLVVDGSVNIRTDDGNRADRTALCLRDGGRTLEVVVARTDDPLGRGGPTLFRFARALLRRGCEQALNLDGGPSTGAAWRDGNQVRFLSPRGPVRHAVAIWLNPAP